MQHADALAALRDAARAALTAERVEDALQLMLDRVVPAAGASFASVFVTDGSPDVLRLAAASHWPEQWRPWLTDMRIKVGAGPSGEAAAQRRVIEVADVFADPALAHWQDVAAELGFRALIALPLASGARTLGAVTFYFAEGGGFTPAQRDLLRIVTDQMALTFQHTELVARMRALDARLAAAQSEVVRRTVDSIEATRTRDEFLANVSHELKTPLTIVLGTIDLLTEELGGPLSGDQHTDLANARAASERLLALVETLLALAELRRGTLTVEPEEFNPRDALRDAVRAAGPAPKAVELAIEEPATFIPVVRGDREKTVRIITCLLSNAFKFTPSGSVTARVDAGGGKVRYRVRDSGIGIPAEALPFIFDEFRQGDSSTTRKYGGTGLGLSLARGLARLMGGDIQVVSEPGAGSTFTVELPLTQG